MAKKKKGKGKQTIDLTLRLNVELEQGKQKPRKERVKRIKLRVPERVPVVQMRAGSYLRPRRRS